MKRSRKFWIGLFAALLGICVLAAAMVYLQFRNQINLAGAIGSGSAAQVSLPPGFSMNVFAEGLNNPRFLNFGPDGVLYVADRGNGRIVQLPDANKDGRADEIRTFADNLNSPHSLVYHENAWYVGVPSGVVRLNDSDGDGATESTTVLIDDYPTRGHSTRTVIFLPDGRLAVSVGSSCNVCDEEDERRASVLVYDGPEAAGEQIFAAGLRNAVGLAIHPQTGELWASNNGRDLMGDDLPPENIYIVEEGANYGWPVCHSGRLVDPDMGYEGACDGVTQPLVEMQAHSAPLGIAFYSGDTFPEEYHNDLFIALHGSWNRSEPTGYKIVRLPLDGSTPGGPVEDFATGWLDASSGAASGRPAGLAVSPDGDLYLSDDKAGLIYRITYSGGS